MVSKKTTSDQDKSEVQSTIVLENPGKFFFVVCQIHQDNLEMF